MYVLAVYEVQKFAKFYIREVSIFIRWAYDDVIGG